MHTSIRRSIVDKHFAVIIGYPAISKRNIHHIANIFFALRNKKIATWLCNDTCGVVERSHIQIQYITKTRSTGTNTMSQMQPSTVCLYWMRAFTILHFHDSMVIALVYNFLFFHLSMFYIINKSPANASTRTSIDEIVLRTGVEGILTINKLRMKNHISLLTL